MLSSNLNKKSTVAGFWSENKKLRDELVVIITLLSSMIVFGYLIEGKVIVL
tara:strand:- start:6422 stop:6574 length:153 start_codon:yes stop_codon:yes gene_type:complete